MRVLSTVYIFFLLVAVCVLHVQVLEGCSALQLSKKKDKGASKAASKQKQDKKGKESKHTKHTKGQGYNPDPKSPEGKRMAMLKNSGLLD